MWKINLKYEVGKKIGNMIDHAFVKLAVMQKFLLAVMKPIAPFPATGAAIKFFPFGKLPIQHRHGHRGPICTCSPSAPWGFSRAL